MVAFRWFSIRSATFKADNPIKGLKTWNFTANIFQSQRLPNRSTGVHKLAKSHSKITGFRNGHHSQLPIGPFISPSILPSNPNPSLCLDLISSFIFLLWTVESNFDFRLIAEVIFSMFFFLRVLKFPKTPLPCSPSTNGKTFLSSLCLGVDFRSE